MFTKIVSIIWIILGIFWLVNPAALQNRFRKKSLKRIKQILFFTSFGIGVYFIGLTFKLQILYLKLIIFVLGVVVLVKGTVFLKSQLSDKFIEHFSKLSLKAFRIYAAVFTVVGIFLYFIK
ncbi:MAG: hypothetical protein GY858_05135 [Candidatus Omnitrophica bacterium]|nr:hypothetical protein [Candidatus Omnitrophota bacterium]